jgi:hypothetical protein
MRSQAELGTEAKNSGPDSWTGDAFAEFVPTHSSGSPRLPGIFLSLVRKDPHHQQICFSSPAR